MYEGSIVVVTGGTGMIGSYIVQELLQRGARIRAILHNRPPTIDDKSIEFVKADLLKRDECVRALRDADMVFHVAAVVGGIQMNIRDPGRLFTNNIILNTQVMDVACQEGVDRYLLMSNNTVYPDHEQHCKEEEGFLEQPHSSALGVGWLKRVAEIQARIYSERYGMKIGIVRPSNAYGRWDNFNLDTSHVVPALIRKALERSNSYVIWGTGGPIRDFIHASDIARGALLVLEKYAICDPVNLATGVPTSIRELAALVLRLTGRNETEAVFDMSSPDGLKVRLLDTSKALEKLGFRPKVSLEEGLRDTITWYRSIAN